MNTCPVAWKSLSLLVGLAVPLPAQEVWTEIATATGPSTHGSMTYDSRRQVVVMFRDTIGTWEWDTQRWTRRETERRPSYDIYAAFTYDTTRGVVVAVQQSSPHTTYEYDGNDWEPRATAPFPLGPNGISMVYHAGRRRSIAFGGTPYSGETWAWDGTTWTRVPTTTNPHPRVWPAMAYDEVRQRIVLFGGSTDSQIMWNDTWEFDGFDWHPAFPPHRPSPRSGHAMAWMPARRSIVMYGGNQTATDTWEYDGVDWTRVAERLPSPGPIPSPLMATNGDRGVLMLGPFSYSRGPKTWEFYRPSQARYERFGQACAGSGGATPMLDRVPLVLPWTAREFEVHVTGMAPSVTVGFMILGFSSESWFGQFALPRALDALGMPQCSLLVRGDLVETIEVRGGAGSWRLPIADDPSLFGMKFYNQAFALDPGANAAGIVVTNAAEGTIHAR